ncbi:Hypothetical predicted protein [Cloeon dipterum]|uniref:Uncharacterized protein n=1 Tax=Cloeon dipterum TaxID=197152 RepID=A0A8S1CNG2_9INSE|nr:Hypothetical predicted protein [Cloeon dipterum]
MILLRLLLLTSILTLLISSLQCTPLKMENNQIAEANFRIDQLNPDEAAENVRSKRGLKKLRKSLKKFGRRVEKGFKDVAVKIVVGVPSTILGSAAVVG